MIKQRHIWKKNDEKWSKIRDLIRSVTINSHDYDEKYTEIKLNLDDDLPLHKMLKFYNIIIVVRSVFYEAKKLPTDFLRRMFI